jgi:hypothetical protein
MMTHLAVLSPVSLVEHGCCVYGEEGIANLIWRSVGHMTSLGTLPTSLNELPFLIESSAPAI